MRTLKKYQKAGQYVWTGQNHTVQKPTGHYNVVATDGKNSNYEDNVTPDLSWYKDPLENTRMVTEQPIEPLYGFKDPVFNLAFLGTGLANGAMKGITEIGEKVVTNKPLWTAISANNIKNRIEDEGFVEGVLGHPVQTTFDLLMLGPAAKGIKTVGNEAIKMPSYKIITQQKIKSSISPKEQQWTPEQWTAAQDIAIARGDMTEAQRLRDLHSTLTPTTTPGKYYRGTLIKSNSYLDRHIDKEVGEMNGIYLTKNPKYAKTYGNVEEFYLHSNNPLVTEGSWTGIIDDATRSEIENMGYDAVVNNKFDTGFLNKLLKNSRDETITFNGKNLKLADAVTYDDNGVRIPLGLRDNFKVNDIRYGLTTLGTTGLGLGLGYKFLNNQQKQSGGESDKMQYDNVRIDPNGFWDKRNIENGKVIIPSNRITMKGVNFPVLGVSDTGDMKVMLPNGEYKFNGNNVTEYKMEKGGKTTIGNTSFDVMESFKKLVLSPEYATQVDNSQQVMQDGGEDDEKEKNPWLNAVDSIRLQDLQPLETYQYEGRIRKNEKQLEQQNVWKNQINDYNDFKKALDYYNDTVESFTGTKPQNVTPEKYQNLDNFYNPEEAINNISNQFYGSTIGLNNINIGTFGKNIIDGNVEYPEIQTTKPRTWAKINLQGVDNLGSTFVNLFNNYGNWREARQKENLSPIETQAAAQYDDLTINDLNNVKWGDRYGFNNPFAYDDTTEVQNRGTFVKYGGRCFDEGGQYDNVTPEELDYLIKNGIKFHF